MKKTILLLLFFSMNWASKIQLVDQQTTAPLPGVNITIVGTDQGLLSDLDGYFNLEDRYRGQNLKFSYIGYIDTTLNYLDIYDIQVIYLTPDVLSLSSVEVVSSKLEWEQEDLPSLVSILRTRDLVNQGSIELKEALQRDPAVTIGESFDGSQEISIRGSNSNEVLIIYDGIPLNSSYIGGFDLSWINLNDIESVSIIKGSGTLKYGSGAFGGVVVLDPILKAKPGLGINYQASDRQLNSYSVSDILSAGKFNARATFSSKEYLPYGPFNPDTHSSRDFLNLYATYGLQDTSNYFSFNYMDISEKVEPNLQLSRQSADTYSQIKYNGQIGFFKNMIIQFLQRSNTAQDWDGMTPRIEFEDETAEKTNWASIENKTILKNMVNLLKVEYKEDEFVGLSTTRYLSFDRVEQHDITLSQTGYAITNIFKYRSEIEVPFIDFMELNASFRYDDNKLNDVHRAYSDGEKFLNEENDSNHGHISKRNGFTIQKSRKHLRYQFFYTSGTNLRYPSMNDFYYHARSTLARYKDNPLKPELNSSSEIGLQANIQPSSTTSIFETIEIQASLYKNNYFDKIYYIAIPGALFHADDYFTIPTPVNLSVSDISGSEISVMAALFNDRLRLFAGTHRLKISSYTVFPNKPEFRDVIELELLDFGLNLRLHYFHEGKQYFGSTADNMNWDVKELEGRENVNLYASFIFKNGRKDYVLGLSVQNLLSDENEMNYFNQRHWTMSIGLSL